MKKISVALIALLGCSKSVENTLLEESYDGIISQKYSSLDLGRLDFTNEGRFLDFPTLSSYEYAVEDPTQRRIQEVIDRMEDLNHKGYNTVLENTNRAEEQTDLFISKILSEDRTVQIGPYVFRVNIEDEIVLVMHESNMEQYIDLVHENYDEATMLLFSTEDDVLTELLRFEKMVLDDDYIPEGCGWSVFIKDVGVKLLSDGLGDFGGSGGGFFCREDHCGSANKTESSFFVNQYGARVGSDIKVRYGKAGIWFWVYAEATRKDFAGLELAIELDKFWIKRRCRKPKGPVTGLYQDDYPSFPVQKYQMYRGIRALNGFHLKARTVITELNAPDSNGNPHTVHKGNWVCKYVNSPYYCN